MAYHVLAWKCEYCGDLKKTKHIADRHEKACKMNPNAQNCLECAKSFYEDTDDGSPGTYICMVDGKLCTRARSGNCTHYVKDTEMVFPSGE